MSFKAHGSDFKPKRLVWQPIVDRIEVGQWQTVQLVGAYFEYGFTFGFSRLGEKKNQQNCIVCVLVWRTPRWTGLGRGRGIKPERIDSTVHLYYSVGNNSQAE